VDLGAELERVADGLPRLMQLTLPGEWALGWAKPESADSAAAPLARLLLRYAGRGDAPTICVALPRPDHPEAAALDAAVRQRIKRVCEAARQVAAKQAGVEVEEAGLPRVELFDGGSSYADWAGWHGTGYGSPSRSLFF
jgi:hypothetical protein